MTCTQKRERENERTRQSRSFSCSGLQSDWIFDDERCCVKKKNFFTSKAHPAVIKNDMVK